MEHLSVDALLREALDEVELAHLDACVGCRVERGRLMAAGVVSGTVEPSQLLESLVGTWIDAVAQAAPAPGAAVRWRDGAVPMQWNRGDGFERLAVRLDPSMLERGRVRFASLEALAIPGLVRWGNWLADLEGARVTASVPALTPFSEAVQRNPAWVVSWVSQVVGAVVALHRAGHGHGDLVEGPLGVDAGGRAVLPPPVLYDQPGFGDDRRALGEWLRELTACTVAPNPPLARLAGALARGDVGDDEQLLAEILEIWQAVSTGAARYLLGEPLGLGGMGEVLRAQDLVLDRSVALKVQRADRPRLAAFLGEARLTAALPHPGIVPVHDVGRLLDGRSYYTMPVIEGPDLTQAIAELRRVSDATAWRRTTQGWTLRRLVEVIARVADALGYAHSRGIVHCDLKPGNIKLGRFGEVRLMDWGISTPVGEVCPGKTPAYVCPEQVRGDPVAPTNDVFGLGRLLGDLLFGRGRGSAPAQGPIPPTALVIIAQDCVAPLPDDRPGDATAVAERLRGWLDGDQRRERSRNTLGRVTRLAQDARDLRERVANLRNEAAELLDGVAPWAPLEEKVHGWRRADEADQLERDAAVLETRYEQGIRAALEQDPSNPAARAALAEVYKAALLRAEARRDLREASRYAIFLESHDGGAHLTWLRGDGAVTLVTDPPGAHVLLERFEEEDRRLVARPVGELGTTPLIAQPLQRGSYLLRIRHPDCEEVRYPVYIERGEHWHGVPPGESEPLPIALPRKGSLAEDDCYVPAGWFRCGGDGEAIDGLPARRVWVDAFVCKRYPVTFGEYVGFLNGLLADGQTDLAIACAPSEAAGFGDEARLVPTWDGRRFSTAKSQTDGRLWREEEPVVLVDRQGATHFSNWLTRRSAHRWRLPHDLEWEKAARSVDGRGYPWGTRLDPAFACMGTSHGGAPDRAAVNAFPLDCSAYGVVGFGGNVRDWCCNDYARGGETNAGERLVVAAGDSDARYAMARGGSWTSVASWCRSAGRFAMGAAERSTSVGFRVCRAVYSARSMRK